MLLYGALDGHPFFPSHVASGRYFLSAAAAGALAGVVSAFAEPSKWCVGTVLNAAWCAVCVSAAPNSWRIEDVLVVAGVPPPLESAWTRCVHLDAPGQRHGQQPVSGTADTGVVKQDKSSRGSVDTTKTRSDPQRVRMSRGERPIGAAKSKQLNTKALCHPPPPPHPQPF